MTLEERVAALEAGRAADRRALAKALLAVRELAGALSQASRRTAEDEFQEIRGRRARRRSLGGV